MSSLQEEKSVEMGKGWTNEGIERFNTLFDKVREDRKKNTSFGKNWIAKERLWLNEQIKKASKRYETIPKARHELFSNSEDDTTSSATKWQKTITDFEDSRRRQWKALQETIHSDDEPNWFKMFLLEQK